MNTVINTTRIKAKRNFDNRVLDLFPNDIGDVYITNLTMSRTSSRGIYELTLEFCVNKLKQKVSKRTNDSELFDWYSNIDKSSEEYQKWGRETIITLFEKYTKFSYNC